MTEQEVVALEGWNVEFVGGGPLDGEVRTYGNYPPPTVRIPVGSVSEMARLARELSEHPDANHDVWVWTYVFWDRPGLDLLPSAHRYVYRGLERAQAGV